MAESIVSSNELERFLHRLPNAAATHLQAVVKKNHNEHKQEVVRTLRLETPEARRRMSFAIKVYPRGFVEPKRIADVEGETVSFWVGRGMYRPEEGAALKLDVSGDQTEKPKKRRWLVIPWSGKSGERSPLMTAGGRPARTKSLRDVKNVFFKRGGKGGGVLLAFRSKRSRRDDPVDREQYPDQVVAILVKRAEHVEGMDFFGAWDRLEPQRAARYARMLDRIAEG